MSSGFVLRRFVRAGANGGFGLLIWLCVAGLAFSATAQESKTIIFDAPGADTKPGDNNGTFSAGINARGAITGNYVDVNNVYHGFLRHPDGTFTTFEAQERIPPRVHTTGLLRTLSMTWV